ncbi:Myosin-3 [Camellia lanceoleosa]|uniref:Myosin-3 n=1 Tax=Camellia lanceoleosa TaxID=1840588 RepID=A0ACC0GKY2_9ERIC|nr:Myosin-3 [Camellia lanceoleosa]
MVMPAVVNVMKEEATLVTLIKPQFEAPISQKYIQDGIDWARVDFEDNQDCLNLFEKVNVNVKHKCKYGQHA